MKKILSTTVLLFLLFLVFSSNTFDSGNSTNARINTYKQECKELIKPARYDGARVTFYAASNEKQIKTVETFFVLDKEYKLAISGKESSVKVNVRIYNSTDENKRILLKEIKNFQGKNVIVSSKELVKVYNKKFGTAERLKTVYLEYEISEGVTKNEAIVFVLGYMD
jgi:hypothetical protein